MSSQPRKLLAKEIASRVREARYFPLRKLIGWQIARETSKDEMSKVLYLT